MNRPSVRGSPAGRASQTYQLDDEPSVHTVESGKVTEEWKIHNNVASPQGASPAKHYIRKGDLVNGNGIYKSDYLSSPDAVKSSLNASASARERRAYAVPLGTTMVLCFVCAFLFIGMLGSRSGAYNLRLVPTLGRHRSYGRLQTDIPVDPFKGGIFGQGSVRMKELPSCDSSFENYVPCYKQERGSERHCQVLNEKKQCLIPPPEEYRLPLRWPESRSGVWSGNMKFVEQRGLSGRRLARLRLDADEIISFDFGASELHGLEGHVNLVLDTISNHAGGHHKLAGILDVNCGLSQLRDQHDFFENSSILCLAPYEANGSQVQYALERGYPAVIGSIFNSQLPISSFSFDMIHVLDSEMDRIRNDGLILLELDRLLKPGGYFVWSSLPSESLAENEQNWQVNKEMTYNICWSTLLEAPQARVWMKATNQSCYLARGLEAKPEFCGKIVEENASWYPPLRPCITRTDGENSFQVSQQLPYAKASTGFSPEELSNDPSVWAATVKSYWSLLTPLIFSDHPKRPGEEDPLPPSNIVRNILDMNALYGSLSSALIDAKKSVWVMNVVPRSGPDTLSVIYKRGLIGLHHDWCEAFPTYPRSFDLLHGIGLLSQELGRFTGCGLSTLFLEMDRILRPEGWVILRDKVEVIEDARIAAGQMRWESRVINVEGLEDQQLLICQKTFWRNPSSKAALL